MFMWFFAAMPFPQTAPFAWTNNIFAWVAVAILGYVILTGAGIGRLGALHSYIPALFG
jgi:hypothetical protein